MENSLNQKWLDFANQTAVKLADFTFAVQTDVHFYPDLDPYYVTNVVELSKILPLSGILNFGDNIRGYADDSIDSPYNMRKAYALLTKKYEDAACPVFLTPGNHDVNIMYAEKHGDYSLLINEKEIYDYLMPTVKKSNAEVNDELYYYADFKDEKIRLIMLNSVDSEFSKGETATFRIGEKQLSWLKNTALDTEYSVIIATHTPLVKEIAANNVINREKAMEIINDFQNKTGRVVACLYGHEHEQRNIKTNGINHISFLNSGSRAEIVTLDFKSRKINTYIVGGGSDREFCF